MGLIIASIVLTSAAAAIYVSTTSRSSASTPVTPIDLGDPGAARAALAFDPFEIEGVKPSAETGTKPLEVAAAGPEQAPGAEASDEEAADDVDADEEATDEVDAEQSDVQTGVTEGEKPKGKMKFGIGAAAAGVAGAAGAGGAAAGAVLGASEVPARSASTP